MKALFSKTYPVALALSLLPRRRGYRTRPQRDRGRHRRAGINRCRRCSRERHRYGPNGIQRAEVRVELRPPEAATHRSSRRRRSCRCPNPPRPHLPNRPSDRSSRHPSNCPRNRPDDRNSRHRHNLKHSSLAVESVPPGLPPFRASKVRLFALLHSFQPTVMSMGSAPQAMKRAFMATRNFN